MSVEEKKTKNTVLFADTMRDVALVVRRAGVSGGTEHNIHSKYPPYKSIILKQATKETNYR